MPAQKVQKGRKVSPVSGDHQARRRQMKKAGELLAWARRLEQHALPFDDWKALP